MPVKKKANEKDNLYGLQEVQVRLRLAEGTTLYSAEPLSDPEGAIRVMASALREMDREFFCVVNMDTRLRPLNFNIVSVGGLNQCQIPIQNVFKASLLSNSACLLLIHNHPTGIVTPSQTDIEVTKRLVEAGRILELEVQDHIIIGGGNGSWYSFRENQPELFEIAGQNRNAVKEQDGMSQYGKDKNQIRRQKRSIMASLQEKRDQMGSAQTNLKGKEKRKPEPSR